MTKVRIINLKTGDHKFVTPAIGNDEVLLKSYGFIKQDLGEKKEVEKTNEGSDLTLEELKEKYEALTGKKAGNKKAETILKEIQDLENVANSNI